jgi:dienelactone hydrolase
MKKCILLLLFVLAVAGSVFVGGKLARKLRSPLSKVLPSSLSPKPSPTPLPLLEYTIENLSHRQFSASSIVLEKKLETHDSFEAWEFSYHTLGKKMTGLVNIPTRSPSDTNPQSFPVVVLVRGYVPLEIYKTGMGTKPASHYFAEHGYVTFSPDFFGYGESDPEELDNWTARFQKPVELAELIKSIRSTPHLLPNVVVNPAQLGIWAHSNGGQIALTTLEVLGEPIPTTLWAPVTAPFPYSVLFFGDETADEGKTNRSDVATFEKKYDVFDFSLTRHLDKLRGPLQFHQGLRDDAIPPVWTPEFIDKLTAENTRRQKILKLQKDTQQQRVPDENLGATSSHEAALAGASASAETSLVDPKLLEPILVTSFTYPTADHNMRGGWDEAIARDLSFFEKWLRSP